MVLDRLRLSDLRWWSYRELRATMTRSQVETAVASGRLLRVWRGAYVSAGLPEAVVAAARQRGRLDCLSLLSLLGVFVQTVDRLHLQVENGSTRMARHRGEAARHWRVSSSHRHTLVADLVEALAQACRCQPPLAAIATLDSALHLRLIETGEIAAVFSRLPKRFAVMLPHLEARSESGTESILRLLLRRRGYVVEVQVRIDGVGRVDLLIDGWLIVECDSEAHHSTWAQQRNDRRRDQAAAALGYTTFRPIAEDILWHPDRVLAAIAGLIVARRTILGSHNVARVVTQPT